MPRTLQLLPHLSSEELQRRYLSSQHPLERTRWHGLWLVSLGKSGAEAARLVGRSDTWLSDVARAYNSRGPQAVSPVQRGGAQWGGKTPSLDEAGLQALVEALAGPAPTGGLWTGAKVALWIERRTGRTTHKVTGCKYLYRAGYTKQTARPAHPEGAGPEEQAAYQKKSSS
jgi:transposase